MTHDWVNNVLDKIRMNQRPQTELIEILSWKVLITKDCFKIPPATTEAFPDADVTVGIDLGNVRVLQGRHMQ
ncbi:GD20598 [Drosophila simulans]|uniref:GD20598 n=1 Tax=Drosophila simulans TaxID=7240 RepID=B4QT08_DROSI|nr:GD20598 [Drosophila simulans]